MASNGGIKLAFDVTAAGCFICTSHKACRKDRGRKSVIVKRNGRTHLLHRWIYELMFGPIDPGLVVRHKCDNGECINPEHMELGTQKENVHDMIARGRDNSFGRKTMTQPIQAESEIK